VLFEAPEGLLSRQGVDGWGRIVAFLVVAGTTVLLLAALQDARRRAEVGVGARDEFVRTVGHELRSPLTVLQARLETQTRRLEERGAPAVNELRDMLIASAHQVRRMERLVARLLDDARLEAGKLVLAPARADLVAIAAAQAAAAQLIDRRHRIVLEAPERAEAVVDPVRVEQVLANLLENAMKFGPRGTAIRVEVAEADGGVRLAVRDAGPGVPPGRRRTLFERGSQAHGAGHGGGLGLGLYVARAVVDAHGGRIWAEFPDEGGSRFVVWLPKIPPRGTRRQEQAA
jgi:signal transduction histidine kinase